MASDFKFTSVPSLADFCDIGARFTSSSPKMRILHGAVGTNISHSIFNVVRGDQYSDIARVRAGSPPKSTSKSSSIDTRHWGSPGTSDKREPLVSHMDVLTDAKGVDASFCVFSQVEGDQYGIPSASADQCVSCHDKGISSIPFILHRIESRRRHTIAPINNHREDVPDTEIQSCPLIEA
jgi:hypothetical protein